MHSNLNNHRIVIYMNLTVMKNQKPKIDTQKIKRKESKHNSEKSHKIIRQERKRGKKEQRRITKKEKKKSN